MRAKTSWNSACPASWPAFEPAIQELGTPTAALVALDGRVEHGHDETCATLDLIA
jgi:hypothetical protein